MSETTRFVTLVCAGIALIVFGGLSILFTEGIAPLLALVALATVIYAASSKSVPTASPPSEVDQAATPTITDQQPSGSDTSASRIAMLLAFALSVAGLLLAAILMGVFGFFRII